MIKTVTTCGNRRMDLRLEIVGQGRQDPRQDSMDAEIQNEFLSYIVDLALLSIMSSFPGLITLIHLQIGNA